MAKSKSKRSPQRSKSGRSKRRGGKKGRKGIQNKVVTNVLRKQPVADRQFVRLKFADVFQYTISVTGTLQMMRGYQSSAFSPRTDGDAHQPMWFDQYAPTFFSSYRCYGVSYVVVIANKNSSGTWWASVRPQNSSTAETSLQSLLERSDARVHQAGPFDSSKSAVSIRGYMSVAKVRGQNHLDVATDMTYQAFYNANPSRMAYLLTYISANNTGTFDVTVRLKYHLEFCDRVTPTGS